MNRFAKPALTALCAVAALAAAAHTVPTNPQERAEQAVKLRQGLFDVQNFAFAPVGAMLKGAPFDAQTVQKEARRIQMTASMIPEVFQTDTRQFQVKTKARAKIWAEKSDFDHDAKALQNAAEQLEAAARTGDRSATLKAAGAVGKACGHCHDEFREK